MGANTRPTAAAAASGAAAGGLRLPILTKVALAAAVMCAIGLLASQVRVADAVMCYMCGTPAVPNCHTTPGAVIGCPGGAMCWTLYDSAEKATVRARGCSMSTKATCQYGPHGVYRCYCGDKHLCNAATPGKVTAVTMGLTSAAVVMALSKQLVMGSTLSYC